MTVYGQIYEHDILWRALLNVTFCLLKPVKSHTHTGKEEEVVYNFLKLQLT